jgi:phosphatidate cytidylyltransferase
MALTRVLTGAGFVAGAAALFAVEHRAGTSLPCAALFLATVVLGMREFYAACRGAGARPLQRPGLVAGGLLVALVWLQGVGRMDGGAAVPLGFVLGLGLVLTAAAARGVARDGVRDAALTLFGLLYVAFLLSFGLQLRLAAGLEALAVVVGAVWVGDTGAYVGGSLFGRHKLAPVLSPGKTVEGLAAGILTGTLGGLAVAAAWPGGTLGLRAGAALATLVSVVAPLGDLSESYIKRVFGLKDSGTLLPGHGGVLDRVDSFLFVFPAAFYAMPLLPGGGA